MKASLKVVDGGLPPAARMAALFAGAPDGWRMTTDGSSRLNGKTVKRYIGPAPVLPDDWQRHLDGEAGLVVVPVRADGTCSFGAIDIDQYGVDHADLVARCERRDLPLIVCRSTSGGAHLYLFLGEPTQASDVRRWLRAAAAAIGHPGAEVFPKQDRLDGDSKGSGINLPYHGGDGASRVAFKKKGIDLSLAEFLAAAERTAVGPDDLNVLPDSPPSAEPPSAAPATRADADAELKAACARLVAAPPQKSDDYLGGMIYFVARHCRDTDLPEAEARDALRRAWMVRNPDDTGGRKFDDTWKRQFRQGWDNGPPATARQAGGLPDIERIWRIEDGDDTTFRLQIDGICMMATSAQMLNQQKFNETALVRLGRAFHLLTGRGRNIWIDHVNEAMGRAETEILEDGTSTIDRFRDAVEEFCVNRHRGEQKEDILVGRPWEDEDEGRHYFRLKDLKKHLGTGSDFAKTSDIALSRMIRQMGGDHRMLVLKGKQTRTFWVPANFVPTPTPASPPIRNEPI